MSSVGGSADTEDTAVAVRPARSPVARVGRNDADVTRQTTHARSESANVDGHRNYSQP